MFYFPSMIVYITTLYVIKVKDTKKCVVRKFYNSISVMFS